MRFAFVVNNYPPRVGGVETHVYSLIRALCAAGHSALVVTTGGGRAGVNQEDGVTVVRTRERLRVGDVLGFPPLGTTRRVAQLLGAEHVDVVSVHTRFFPMTWVGLKAARRRGIPVIHTEHGSGHVVSSSRAISIASRLVDWTVGRAVLNQADAVVGVSENVVAFVRQLSGRQGYVFYNAIEPPMTSVPRVRGARAVFVGRLVEGKGAGEFVEAIAILSTAGVAVTGVVLGDGPERARVAMLIKKHRLDGIVEMRGRVPAADVRAALSGAVLVNPTVLAEGFQTTLLEALAEGGKVVTYDVPGADLLKTQGHPVIIVGDRSASSLAAALAQALADTTAPLPLEGWYWEDRAAEYATIADRVRSPGGVGPTG